MVSEGVFDHTVSIWLEKTVLYLSYGATKIGGNYPTLFTELSQKYNKGRSVMTDTLSLRKTPEIAIFNVVKTVINNWRLGNRHCYKTTAVLPLRAVTPLTLEKL